MRSESVRWRWAPVVGFHAGPDTTWKQGMKTTSRAASRQTTHFCSPSFWTARRAFSWETCVVRPGGARRRSIDRAGRRVAYLRRRGGEGIVQLGESGRVAPRRRHVEVAQLLDERSARRGPLAQLRASLSERLAARQVFKI